MVLVQAIDPLGQVCPFGALVDGEHKQSVVCIEGELIHGIDSAHVVQDEKKNCSAFRARSISLSRQIYLFFRPFTNS